MKITDTDIKKIEQLSGTWQVEMPDERFFVNLPVKVLERALERPRPLWSRLALPAGAAAAAALMLGAGLAMTVGQARDNGRMMRAAAEWNSESDDWEHIDQALAEARESGVTGLHRYFDGSGLETAATAMELYPTGQESDYALASDTY